MPECPNSTPTAWRRRSPPPHVQRHLMIVFQKWNGMDKWMEWMEELNGMEWNGS